jgi:hypothetical protein
MVQSMVAKQPQAVSPAGALQGRAQAAVSRARSLVGGRPPVGAARPQTVVNNPIGTVRPGLRSAAMPTSESVVPLGGQQGAPPAAGVTKPRLPLGAAGPAGPEPPTSTPEPNQLHAYPDIGYQPGQLRGSYKELGEALRGVQGGGGAWQPGAPVTSLPMDPGALGDMPLTSDMGMDEMSQADPTQHPAYASLPPNIQAAVAAGKIGPEAALARAQANRPGFAAANPPPTRPADAVEWSGWGDGGGRGDDMAYYDSVRKRLAPGGPSTDLMAYFQAQRAARSGGQPLASRPL